MITSLKKDTLAYQLGIRPAFQKLDFSHAHLPTVAQNIVKYRALSNIYPAGMPSLGYVTQEAPKGHPEVDALVFYMMNHAVSLVRQRVHPLQPLDKYLPIVQAHAREMAVRSSRMFFYMLLICTRESRHDHSSNGFPGCHDFHPSIRQFHMTLKHKGSTGSAEALQTNAPSVPLGEYTKYLKTCFYKGSFSSGFGGKAWGKVADVLDDFVHGRLTAELMMDTAFTLCHNNGPIFNKGMLFETHSNDIYRILDVQRSGQIPQLVDQGGVAQAKKGIVKALWARCHSVLGSEFEGSVDYYKVEELGSLHKYPKEKAAQDASNGTPLTGKAYTYTTGKSFTPLPGEYIHPVTNKVPPSDLKLTPASGKVEIFPGEFLKKVSVR